MERRATGKRGKTVLPRLLKLMSEYHMTNKLITVLCILAALTGAVAGCGGSTGSGGTGTLSGSGK